MRARIFVYCIAEQKRFHYLNKSQVWDMRTKANIMTLSGHTNTVADVKCQAALPEVLHQFIYDISSPITVCCLKQVITASHDCTVRLWDLAAGKTRSVLTNHKKSIRSIALHPTQSVDLILVSLVVVFNLMSSFEVIDLCRFQFNFTLKHLLCVVFCVKES